MRLLLLAATVFSVPALAIELQAPIDCDLEKVCAIQQYVDHDPGPGARDYRCGTMVYDGHKGTDFRVPSLLAMREGVDVLASASGRVVRVRDGVADVVILGNGKASPVEGSECGNGIVLEHAGGFETQYCHLAEGSVRVRPGDEIAAGHPLGKVGLSGKTQFPHVHFSVRKDGRTIDPFASTGPNKACGDGTSIWSRSVTGLSYRPGRVLNQGFVSKTPTLADVEDGTGDGYLPEASAAALVAYVRVIGLRSGDIQRLIVLAPGRQLLADSREQTPNANKAQLLLYAGRKRPNDGWIPGLYTASYTVYRDGALSLRHSFEFEMR